MSSSLTCHLFLLSLIPSCHVRKNQVCSKVVSFIKKSLTNILCSFLALVLPLVHALQLSTPTNVASGGSVTITWTPAAGDPAVFSVYLVNTVFHDNFGVANNVQSSAGTLTLQLPIVPAR